MHQNDLGTAGSTRKKFREDSLLRLHRHINEIFTNDILRKFLSVSKDDRSQRSVLFIISVVIMVKSILNDGNGERTSDGVCRHVRQ